MRRAAFEAKRRYFVPRCGKKRSPIRRSTRSGVTGTRFAVRLFNKDEVQKSKFGPEWLRRIKSNTTLR